MAKALPLWTPATSTTTTVASKPSAYALRISVTDACGYACPYCAPGSVHPFLPRARLLSAAQHVRVARALATTPVRKVRFTGGEPLGRADLVDVVAAYRAVWPHVPFALTTNGARLAAAPDTVRALHAAGIGALTLHVDSLRPERYRTLMGNADVDDILAVAVAARDMLHVKLNVVLQRGRNDDEINDFLTWSQRTGIEVRFIELMNTGSASAYTAAVFLPGAEIVARAGVSQPVARIDRSHASDPAQRFRRADGVTFGVIASDTEPFCDACDRLRLSADGVLRGCLYEPGGVSLVPALASDDDVALAAAVARAVGDKRSFHPGRVAPSERAPFSMAETGG